MADAGPTITETVDALPRLAAREMKHQPARKLFFPLIQTPLPPLPPNAVAPTSRPPSHPAAADAYVLRDCARGKPLATLQAQTSSVARDMCIPLTPSRENGPVARRDGPS